MIFTSQKQIDACLEKWQKILRLQDWRVTARIAPAKEFSSNDNGAEIYSRPCLKEARILLRDPIDWRAKDVEQDHEFEVVHELLHLYTTPLVWAAEEKADYQVPEENIANIIGAALVQLDRRVA